MIKGKRFQAVSKLSATVNDNGEAVVEGQAVGYNQVGEFFGVKISVAPGAAVESIKKKEDSSTRDILMLAGHDYTRILGRVANGTLSFADTPVGLTYRGTLDLEDPDGLSAYRKIKRGTITAASMGFSVEEAEKQDDDVFLATEIELYEVSLVAQGVYESATSRLAAARMWLPPGFDIVEVSHGTESKTNASTDSSKSEVHPRKAEVGVELQATNEVQPDAREASEEVASDIERPGKPMSVVQAELKALGIL